MVSKDIIFYYQTKKGTLEHYVRNRRSRERKAEQEDEGESSKETLKKKSKNMRKLINKKNETLFFLY
jgi:uncharacterized FlaG/YvyC family protein